MSFLVFRGTAEVIEGHDGFRHGAIHTYVCVAPEKELAAALEAANRKAKKSGFAIKTVDGSPMLVPAWRRWLPTYQGRALREARAIGTILTLSRESRE
jgi:hypothetical protein